MTTLIPSRRTRTAAAVLLASAASAAGMVGIAAPAYAAGQFIALAVGFVNENPPVTMAGGSGISGTESGAASGALTNCSGNGAGHCAVQVIAKNECAAAASNDYGERTGATGATRAVAESRAKSMLENSTGAKIIVSGCANGSTPPPSNDPPPPPPQPKLGPTVSFRTILGGLEASITDRSGESSQCTYATDGYNRAFALSANSTYNLRIVPAVPRFRNWTVTITCDNGTKTTATTFF